MMVTRRLLTSDFVNEVQPPTKGEIWIADTVVRGFGLRVWATQSGGQKAFAVRTSDSNGKSVRQSFNDNYLLAALEAAHGQHLTKGDVLSEARDWAKDAITSLKAHKNSDEWRINCSRNSKRVRNIRLELAAKHLLRNMRVRGLTERYVDRLDKLFATHVPQKIKSMPLGKVTPRLIAKALVKSAASPYNVVTLRSFLSQIFLKASHSHGPFDSFPAHLSDEFRPRWRKDRDVPYPELRKLKPKDYQAIFAFLEKHPRWQQGLAVRAYFEFKVPLQRVLAARWSQIWDEHWFPYAPGERVYWVSYEERIEEGRAPLLQLINQRVTNDFGRSAFWFPSKTGTSIQTIGSTWKEALEEIRLPYYPLREFSRSYRDLNCPSYYIDFLRFFGPILDKARNVAELSKTLTGRNKSSIFSDNYR